VPDDIATRELRKVLGPSGNQNSYLETTESRQLQKNTALAVVAIISRGLENILSQCVVKGKSEISG